jgi:hypothetical protein
VLTVSGCLRDITRRPLNQPCSSACSSPEKGSPTSEMHLSQRLVVHNALGLPAAPIKLDMVQKSTQVSRRLWRLPVYRKK